MSKNPAHRLGVETRCCDSGAPLRCVSSRMAPIRAAPDHPILAGREPRVEGAAAHVNALVAFSITTIGRHSPTQPKIRRLSFQTLRGPDDVDDISGSVWHRPDVRVRIPKGGPFTFDAPPGLSSTTPAQTRSAMGQVLRAFEQSGTGRGTFRVTNDGTSACLSPRRFGSGYARDDSGRYAAPRRGRHCGAWSGWAGYSAENRTGHLSDQFLQPAPCGNCGHAGAGARRSSTERWPQADARFRGGCFMT